MHPSYLKVSSNDDYSLDSLALTTDSLLPPLPGRHAYTSQAVLFGPDAAVEVKDGKIALYMHGAVTENQAFKEFVEEQAYAVHRRVAGLTTDPKDVVTFIGKWYHVDYDEDPFFRPYVIKILRANGLVEFLPSKQDIFWTDEDNSYFTGEFVEPKKLTASPASLFREASETCIRRHILHPFDSGFNSFGGILWHATIPGYPMVYVALEGAITHRAKENFSNGVDVDPAYVQPFKVLDEAIAAFKTCLRGGTRGSCLVQSLAAIKSSIEFLPGDSSRTEARTYLTALLRDHYVDPKGDLLEKQDFPADAAIKLGQIPLETKAKGYWLIQKDDLRTHEDEPRYVSFLHGANLENLDVILNRSAPTSVRGYEGACAYASEWIPSKYGKYRYLAFGPERTLTW